MADRATATARPKGVGFPSIVVVILFATADSPALARANAEDNGRTFPINCVVTVWGTCLNLCFAQLMALLLPESWQSRRQSRQCDDQPSGALYR